MLLGIVLYFLAQNQVRHTYKLTTDLEGLKDQKGHHEALDCPTQSPKRQLDTV